MTSDFSAKTNVFEMIKEVMQKQVLNKTHRIKSSQKPVTTEM